MMKKHMQPKKTSPTMDMKPGMGDSEYKSNILPVGTGGDKAVEKLLNTLMPAQSRIHWLHLNTPISLVHEELNNLFDCLYEGIDAIGEQYVEHYGPIPDYEKQRNAMSYDCPHKLVTDIKDMLGECVAKDKGIQLAIDSLYKKFVLGCYKLKLT